MPSLNRAILLGTLTSSPAFRKTARGTPICTFDLQVDTHFTVRGLLFLVILDQGEHSLETALGVGQ